MLQERARELGVDLHFEHEASADLDDWKGYDLVIAADGANSRIRTRYEEHLGVDIQTRRNKFFWFGTKRSEEHTSELQSLMRISYAVFCWKKKKHTNEKMKRE